MKTIKIEIPGMQSGHCQMRVNNAVKDIDGVIINELKQGSLEVELLNPEQEGTLIHAIEAAGYAVTRISREEELTSENDETFLFKTDISCAGCVTQVSSALESASGICHWDVDINSKDKVLTVHSEGISREEVLKAVESAGFKAEAIRA